MNEGKKPALKLADNLAETITFVTEPISAYKLEKEFNGQPSISYIYDIIRESDGSEMVWFATEKQQATILNKGVIAGKKYTVVKSKPAGQKWVDFMISESGVLHLYNQSAQLATTPPPTPQSQVSASPVQAESNNEFDSFLKPRGSEEAWSALEIAVLSMGPIVHEKEGFNGLMKEIKIRAVELMKAHSELTA